jgi:hypothetical protein
MNQLLHLLQRVSLFAIVLGLLSTGILGAADGGKAKSKSYSITVSNPIKVGSVTLKPGDYKVKLEGSEAVFLRVASNETFKVPAKIESSTDKYPKTALIQNTEGGQSKLVGLGLKGTSDVMKFE